MVFVSKIRLFKSLYWFKRQFLQKKIQKFSTNQEAGNEISRETGIFSINGKSSFHWVQNSPRNLISVNELSTKIWKKNKKLRKWDFIFHFFTFKKVVGYKTSLFKIFTHKWLLIRPYGDFVQGLITSPPVQNFLITTLSY